MGSLARIAVVSATQFLTVFDGIAVVIALPAIADDYGLATVDAQWVITAYTLPFAGFLLPAGRLGDLLGRRALARAGLGVFAAALAGAVVAPSWPVLLVARVVQGLGAAAAGPAAFALIGSERRGGALAAASVAGSGGAVAAMALSGVVVDTLGWKWIFAFSIPVALAAAAVAGALPERRPERTAEGGVDAVAAVLATGGVALLVFGITNVERPDATAATTAAALALAAALVAGFFARQRRVAAPLIPPRLLTVPALRRAAAGMVGEDFAYNAVVLVGLLTLQRGWHYGAAESGLRLLPFAVANAVAAPLAGRLLRHWQQAHVAAAGLVLSAGGLLVFAAGAGSGRYGLGVLPALVVLGPGIALGFVALSDLAGRGVRDADQGVAYGVFETTTHVSGTIAVATLATVIAAASFAAAFVVAAGVAFVVAAGLGAATSTARPGWRRRRPRRAWRSRRSRRR